MGLSAAGDYVPFQQVAAEALRAVSGYRLAEQNVELVMAGFAELPAHPDAEPALRTLAEAGLRLCCLTNGSADATAAFLARSGLERYIERVISAAEAGTWKPPARVYHHAAAVLGLPPAQIALIAVHARRERLSLDKVLVPRWPWWRFAAEPHAVDRVRGAPLVEPVVVGEHRPGRQSDGRAPPAPGLTPSPGHLTRRTGLSWARRSGQLSPGPGPGRGRGTHPGRAPSPAGSWAPRVWRSRGGRMARSSVSAGRARRGPPRLGHTAAGHGAGGLPAAGRGAGRRWPHTGLRDGSRACGQPDRPGACRVRRCRPVARCQPAR
jgi:HAD superfamily hydrolase (TIGR01493 family)